MKTILLFLALLFTFNLHSQTLDIEKKYLSQKIKEGKYSHEDKRELSKAWSDLLAKYNGYPNLPYNEETDAITYSYVRKIPDMKKEEIYRKVKEWIAINYGNIKNVIHYEDEASGKIIAKGIFKINADTKIAAGFWGTKKRNISIEIDCNHTAIFYVKNEKLKIDFINLNYSGETGGYTSGNVYVPRERVEFSMYSLYPVTKAKKEFWEHNLSLLYNTTERVEATILGLSFYVANNKAEEF